jgi:CheY-like chemotaxis protein
VLDAGRHLLALINDILDVSKIEAGKLTLDQGPIAVDSLCQASVNLVKQGAAQKQLEIAVTVEPAVKLIFGDERRLKQILVNLLNNAVKFTPPLGRLGLDVWGEPLDEVVHFTVWDTGIGIAEKDMPELFKPFIQLDSRLTRQHEGTGLGLTLVHRMVDLHGGSITVESALGAGAKFTVALPWRSHSLRDFARMDGRTSPQPAVDAATDIIQAYQPYDVRAEEFAGYSPGKGPAPRAAKLLLVEDSETNIQTFTDYLVTSGYQVTVARSGIEALTYLTEIQPDINLLDIQMPELDGWEVARRIRTKADSTISVVPIIALTALAMPGDRERCLAVGMNEYLSKPVSLRRLVQVIAAQLQPIHSSTGLVKLYKPPAILV